MASNQDIVRVDGDGVHRLADRLFEMLVDIADEGPRSMSELRFYSLRSFLPEDPDRGDVMRRLSSWIDEARGRDWIRTEGRWEEVSGWLCASIGDPTSDDPGPGPELRTTRTWADLVGSKRVEPQGATAWTWPEGSLRTWSAG